MSHRPSLGFDLPDLSNRRRRPPPWVLVLVIALLCATAAWYLLAPTD